MTYDINFSHVVAALLGSMVVLTKSSKASQFTPG